MLKCFRKTTLYFELRGSVFYHTLAGCSTEFNCTGFSSVAINLAMCFVYSDELIELVVAEREFGRIVEQKGSYFNC